MMINPLLFGHDHLRIQTAADEHILREAVVRFVGIQLQKAIDHQGCAVLAVSGGRSPQTILKALAQLPLHWSRVSVILVDERAVGLQHALSNTTAIQDWLIRDRAQHAELVKFTPDHADVISDVEGLADAANLACDGLPDITVGILGLGADGHIASIFAQPPGSELISPKQTKAYCAARLDAPPAEAPVDRVTLSLAKLLRAEALVLPVVGRPKRVALRHGLEAADTRWPVSLLLHQAECPLHIWLEDESHAL